jgi:hypothetical protein
MSWFPFKNKVSHVLNIKRYLGIFHQAHNVMGRGKSMGNKRDKVPFVREFKTTFP